MRVMQRWTPEEVEELKRRYPVDTIDVVCAALGRTESKVRDKACRLGIAVPAQVRRDRMSAGAIRNWATRRKAPAL